MGWQIFEWIIGFFSWIFNWGFIIGGSIGAGVTYGIVHAIEKKTKYEYSSKQITVKGHTEPGICHDGSITFSSGKGTCSYHGGMRYPSYFVKEHKEQKDTSGYVDDTNIDKAGIIAIAVIGSIGATIGTAIVKKYD